MRFKNVRKNKLKNYLGVKNFVSFVFAMNNSSGPLISHVSYVVTTELWIQYVGFYIGLGLIATGLNMAVFLLIYNNKKLKTFFFVIIAGHSVSQVAMSFSFVILGIYRLLPAYIPDLINIPRICCHTINLLVYLDSGLNSEVMCLISLDRLYALTRPISYQNRTAKQGLLILVGLVMGNLMLKIIPSYAGSVPLSKVIACTTSAAPVTAEWFLYHNYTNFTMVFFGVFIYIFLFILAFIKTRLLKSTVLANNQPARLMLKRQLKLMNIVRYIIVLNCLTIVPYNILLIISNKVKATTAPRLVVYGGCLAAINIFLDPILLILGSTELRRSVQLASDNQTVVRPLKSTERKQ